MRSVAGSPDESLSYGIANEMLVEHKNSLGRGSFIIFPQLRLLWNLRKREDRRCDIPDIGLGRLTAAGTIHLQGGLEQKPALEYMKNLPPPSDISNIDSLRATINKAAVQASDQVKAALKNGCIPRNTTIKWIMASGPYFVIQEFGPYTTDDLTTRGHKPNPSGDAVTAGALKNMVDNAREMPIWGPLYLIGTREAAAAVHNYLTSGMVLYQSIDREVTWYALLL